MSGTGHWTEAWRRDCERVGLTDTSIDLAEIKRAYAKTLRVTRPDDDAQAYQDLREAYDRVVAHARGEQHRLADSGPADRDDGSPASLSRDDGVAALAPPTVVATTTHDAPAEVRHDADRANDAEHRLLVEQRSPQALCAWVEERTRAGSQALSDALPELRLELQQLPLSNTPEASVRFADLLLRLSGHAPPELVQLLKAHFTWVGDFRIERLLGAHRMEALRRLLAGRVEPVTDPELLREYTPIVHLGSWIVSRFLMARWRARLAILLMGHTLLSQMNRVGEATLRRLGLDATDDHEIRRTAVFAHVVHLLLLTGVIWGSMRLVGMDEDRTTLAAWLILSNAIAFQAASYGLHIMLDFVQTLGGIKAPKEGRKDAARSGRWEKRIPWIGVVAFALAGVTGAVGPAIGMNESEQTAAVFACFFFGFVLMPLPLPMLTAALLCWGGVMAALPTFSVLWAGLVAAWVAAGTLVLWLGLYAPEPVPVTRAQPGWPRGGIGAALALGTVGLPTLIAWLSVRCGQRSIVAAFMIAAAVGVVLREAHLPTGPAAFAVPVALAVVLAAQRFGWWAGRRLMAGVPASRS